MRNSIFSVYFFIAFTVVISISQKAFSVGDVLDLVNFDRIADVSLEQLNNTIMQKFTRAVEDAFPDDKILILEDVTEKLAEDYGKWEHKSWAAEFLFEGVKIPTTYGNRCLQDIEFRKTSYDKQGLIVAYQNLLNKCLPYLELENKKVWLPRLYGDLFPVEYPTVFSSYWVQIIQDLALANFKENYKKNKSLDYDKFLSNWIKAQSKYEEKKMPCTNWETITFEAKLHFPVLVKTTTLSKNILGKLAFPKWNYKIDKSTIIETDMEAIDYFFGKGIDDKYEIFYLKDDYESVYNSLKTSFKDGDLKAAYLFIIENEVIKAKCPSVEGFESSLVLIDQYNQALVFNIAMVYNNDD